MMALTLHSSRGFKLLFALLFFTFTFQFSNAAKWYVSKDGNDTLNGRFQFFSAGYDGPKQNIASALQIANPGDTIYIAKGNYAENIEINDDIYISADSVTLKHLNVNGPSVYCLLMGTYLDISDTLEFNKGFIYINSPSFKLRTLVGSLLLGGSSTSHVEGRFYRALDGGTGRILYPIGISGDYRPVYLNYHQTPGDDRFHWFEMITKPSPFKDSLPAGIRNISAVRYWNFGRDGDGPPTDYVFEVGYDSTLADDYVYEQNGLRLVFKSNSQNRWVNLQGNGSQTRIGILAAGFAADTAGFLTLGNIDGSYNPLGTTLPFARFAYSGNCQKSAISFVDRSTNLPAPKIDKWFWDFGVADSTSDTSTLSTPKYSYANPGTYKVKMYVGNDSGMIDSTEKTIFINALPKVKFSASVECLNDLTKFVDSSSVLAPDSIQTRNWKLSDGFVGSGKKLSHSFPAFGTFNITLISTSSAGCKDSAKGTTTVRPLPKLGFTTSNVCSTDSAVYKRIKGLDPADADFKYDWNVDNAIVGSDTVLKYRYNNAAIHKVILIATDKFGCVDLVLMRDTSFGPPKISFTLASSILGNDSLQCKTTNKFTFTKKITAAQNQTFAASWKYGDGATGALADSSHTYASTGLYTVKLLAQTNRGCKDSFSRTYKVRGTITPVIAKLGTCAPDSATLYDSATASTSAVTSWKWELPGGLTTTGKSIRIWNKFPTPGPVKLIVTNAEGCMDSVSKSFSYILFPQISMITSGSLPFCPGDSLVVVSLSGGTNYLWLNDNDTNSMKKVFKTAGLFPVKAFNGPLCSRIDSSLIITVKAAAQIKAYSDTAIQRGSFATLRASGGVSYTWSPALYLNKVTGSTVKSTPIETQSYILTGTNAGGCVGKDTVTVTLIEPAYVRIPNIITPNGDGDNDAWVLSDMKNLNIFDLVITDYAGKIVFTSSNYQNDWNATSDGKELAEGVYYYKLKNRNSPELIKGFIQVIR